MARLRAVVAGASSAIGSAIAAALAASGHDPVLWGRDTDRLDATAEAVRRAGGTPTVRAFDVSDRSALDAAASAVCDAGPVGALVWAAGRFDWGAADQADPDAWDRLFDVNLAAPAVATRRLLPALLAHGPGAAIVYIGSGAARQAFANNAAYVASKHGLAGLAEAVWLDVRDRGIKVSLVSPGLVAAGAGLRSPAGAERPETLLQPEDVAAAVRFVLAFPSTACPTEIRLQPQRTP